MSNYKSNLQLNNSALSTNNADLQSLIDQVDNLPDASDGVELPTLTNEGSASDLLSGKQLIDQEGNVVTGTIQTKTSSNLTTSGATVTVPAGYYASQATKSVSAATQATPSVTVSSSGLITAKSTQSAGYVNSGTKSATKQLTTQAAKTITPSTSSQTAVASGVYTTGAVTVGAIPDSYIVGNEINEQDSLIAQIVSALEGKAGSDGGNTVKMINFTLIYGDSSSPTQLICEAEEGMSFGSWVCSNYNPIYYELNNPGFCVAGSDYMVYNNEIMTPVVSLNNTIVHPRDKIIENEIYYATYTFNGNY